MIDINLFSPFQLQRNILATVPRVTRFKIDWGEGQSNENKPPKEILGQGMNSGLSKPEHILDNSLDEPLKLPCLDNDKMDVLSDKSNGHNGSRDSDMMQL